MGTIQQRFEEFDRLNPEVYDILVGLAKEWYARTGGRRISIETFFGVMRWEMNMRTNDPSSDFKLNDHYTSRYVRKLLRGYPHFDCMFQTRALRSA